MEIAVRTQFRIVFALLAFLLVTQFAFASPECEPGYVCFCTSPILIDVGGNGFSLTDAANGVTFDIVGNGRPLKIAWTAPGALNAWLALDRDGNGRIDSGKELFGNFTQQPDCKQPNGFLALAEYDKFANGGNGDGFIDANDSIYSSLRLWVDADHNGISEPQELFTLPQLGVRSIGLDYKESRKHDRNGNLFRYRSRVNQGVPHSQVGMFAFDVFLSSTRQRPTPLGSSIHDPSLPASSSRPVPLEIAYTIFLRQASCEATDPDLAKQRCAAVQKAVGLSPQDEARIGPHLAGLLEDLLNLDGDIVKAGRGTDSDHMARRQSLVDRRRNLVMEKISTLRQKLSPEGQARLDDYLEDQRSKIRFIPASQGGVK
jgi:hypothetical protein